DMLNFPETEKKIRSRISSYKSSLNKEMKAHGYISDGAGKRYSLFWLFFALGDIKKFEEYISWYSKEFPDDVGEPAQKLCWTLGLRRMERGVEAKYMLAELMLSNLYLIPQLLGEDIEEYDIWHSSNYGHLDYIEYIPEELLALLSAEDLVWISDQYQSFVFHRMRKKYIEIYGQLKQVKELEPRQALLKESYSIMDYLNE
ncbi:hypothetical protein OAH87_02730, partial [Marinomonas sp.]